MCVQWCDVPWRRSPRAQSRAMAVCFEHSNFFFMSCVPIPALIAGLIHTTSTPFFKECYKTYTRRLSVHPLSFKLAETRSPHRVGVRTRVLFDTALIPR